MKIYSTIAGNVYTVSSPVGDTIVTDERNNKLCVVTEGTQRDIRATGCQLKLDVDTSILTSANFKQALAITAGGGGVSEEDLVELGVLSAAEVPTVQSTSQVCSPDNAPVFIAAKGFRCSVRVRPSTGCNGIAIVVGTGVKDSNLLGCQMELVFESSGSVTLTSEPLVHVQDIAAGRRCLFYFAETIPSASSFYIRILQNGENILMSFSCGARQWSYLNVSWLDAVSSGSGYYPALAWHVLKKETVYSPAVDEMPTEGSALPVSSGGVFSALEAVGGEDAHSAYELHILGNMYIGDAYWSTINHGGEVVIPLGGTIRMVKLTGDNGGESPVRALLILSEPKTAQQLSAYLLELTLADAEQFYLVPVTVNG